MIIVVDGAKGTDTYAAGDGTMAEVVTAVDIGDRDSNLHNFFLINGNPSRDARGTV
jgi:hypothetical protein